eukprot:gene256-9538_t
MPPRALLAVAAAAAVGAAPPPHAVALLAGVAAAAGIIAMAAASRDPWVHWDPPAVLHKHAADLRRGGEHGRPYGGHYSKHQILLAARKKRVVQGPGGARCSQTAAEVGASRQRTAAPAAPHASIT